MNNWTKTECLSVSAVIGVEIVIFLALLLRGATAIGLVLW